MYNTSPKYKEEISKSVLQWKAKIIINNVTYEDFYNLTLKSGIVTSDTIAFGETASSYIDVTIAKKINSLKLEGQKASLYFGLVLSDDSIEWVKMGIFNIVKPIVDDDSVSFTAYDNMYLTEQGFFTDLSGNQKIAFILLEQCTKIGISYAGGDDGSSIDVDKLKGLKIREAISVCASYCGTNAFINRDGNLQLKWFVNTNIRINADRFVDPLNIGEDDFRLTKLVCATGNKEENPTYTSGNDVGLSISFSNQFMTQSKLDSLLNRINNFSYRQCSIDMILGQPEIDVGDIITVIDKHGTEYKVPVFVIDTPFQGGVSQVITATARNKNEENFQFQGALSHTIERNYTEYISTKELLADSIKAFTGKFGTIEADNVIIKNKLNAFEGNFGTINGELANLQNAIIGKADITDLNAASGKINVLESQVSTITTLIGGSATVGDIHTIVLNAENTTIANALIKSAMIDSLTANKITAGVIDASSIHFKSKSGNMDLFDNTLLIKDATRPRVQMGKDAAGDYNIYVWDKTGKLMFDATGVTADGIQQPIIRDDMVSPNANIDGSKINITSLVTEINGSTTKINSSHVLYDDKSLDVAFNEMQTTVEGNNTTIGNLSTQLTVQQGKIATLITDTSQTQQDLTDTKGTVTTLQTNYSSLQQTVTGLSTTVGQHTSSITKVQNDFDNLQISGRNLIKKSSFDTFDKTYWTATTGSTITTGITDPNGGKRALHLKVAQANSFILLNRSKQVFPFVGVYSLSIWLRGNKAGKVDATLNSSSAHPTGKYITCDVTTTWQKFTLTCNVDNLSLLYDFVIGGYNSWVDLTLELDIAFPMLVTGNKPTDWIPAPEDTASDIKAVSDKQTSFQATLDGISGKVSNIENTTTSHTNSINGLTTTVNETKSAVANLKLDYDGFKVNVSNTYTNKTEFTVSDELNRALALMATGKLLYQDPTFVKGVNGVGVYDNSGKGNLIVARIAKPADCPTLSGYCMKITSKDLVSPGLGGFVQSISSRANAKFIVKYLIKLPVGYTLHTATNSIGHNTAYDKFVGSNVGAGLWAEYIRIIQCGADGPFSTSGYVYVMGPTPTALKPLEWYLGAVYAYDVTDADDVYAKFENYSTTVQMNSAITQKANEINLSVSQNYASKSSLNDIDTRMSTAEQKITAEAIVSTVTSSSEWIGLPNSVQQSMMGTATPLPNNIDLDTYITPGIWTTPGLIGAIHTPPEFQSNSEVRLVVEYIGNSLYVQQTLIATYSGNPKGMWKRSKGYSSWYSWEKIANTGNIVSCINQTAETIKIQASKIQLEGTVTANNYFRINTDGSIEAVNGKFSGIINASSGRFSGDIIGGSITGNTTISVGTDLRVGDNVYVGTNPAAYKKIEFNSDTIIDRLTLQSGNHLAMRSNLRASIMASAYGRFAVVAAYTPNSSESIVDIQGDKVVVTGRLLNNLGSMYCFSPNVQSFGHNAGGSTGTYLSYQSGNYAFGIDSWLSDARIKKNIAPTKVKALSVINAIQHSSFDRTDVVSHIDCGYVAQQLELLDIRFITKVRQPDGSDICQINSTTVIPYITKAMQELSQNVVNCNLDHQRELQNLKNEYDARLLMMENRIRRLESRLN